MSRTSIVMSAAVLTLALTASARAHRSAQAPVETPHASRKAHVAFLLPNGGWKQLAGASAGTPELGSYERVPRPGCVLDATVYTSLASRPASVHGHSVSLKPGSSSPPRFTYTAHGHGHGVTWWAGRSSGHRAHAVGGGQQRAPASLATKKRHWLIYRITVTPALTGPTTCTDAEATSTAHTIARHMHLIAGAEHPHGPYATA